MANSGVFVSYGYETCILKRFTISESKFEGFTFAEIYSHCGWCACIVGSHILKKEGTPEAGFR